MSTYAKIEHSLYDNPKIVGLSCEAFRAYVEGILYSGKNLTDGFLDERIVSRMWGTQVAEELATNDPVNPSWQRVEGGWLIYGFTERQNTKEHVESVKKKRKEAVEKRWSDAKAKQNANTTDTKAIQNEYKTDTKAIPDTDTDTDTDTNKELKRGTRLQHPFVLTNDMIKWAVEKYPLVDFHLQTEAFIDYWTSQPGQKGVKSDWVATWRNWIRNSRPTLQPAKPVQNTDWMKSEPIVLP
jgi:hypothetical protein